MWNVQDVGCNPTVCVCVKTREWSSKYRVNVGDPNYDFQVVKILQLPRSERLESARKPKTLTLICFSFFWSFSSHSIIFHSFGDVTIAGKGLQILTYAGHLWPLSSEGSLACKTYCDTGQPDYNGHLRLPVTLTPIAKWVAKEPSLSVFNDLGLSRLRFERLPFAEQTLLLIAPPCW